MRVRWGEIEMDAGRAVERAVETLRRFGGQRPEPGCGEIASDACNPRGVRAVRRHRDVDHWIVEPGEARVRDADRSVVREFDDAFVIVAKLQFRRRAQHAVRLDAANDALGECQLLAGDIGSNRREHALHARPRIGRAADDLLPARASVDDADFQPVGVRMGFRLDQGGDDEAFIFAARILDAFHFEANARQRIDDLSERCRCVEVVVKPGESEFHFMTGICLAQSSSSFRNDSVELIGSLKNLK